MSLLSTIKRAASVATKATYDGRVVVMKNETGYYVTEHTDHCSYDLGGEEIFSFDTSPYNRGSAAALVRYAREELHI